MKILEAGIGRSREGGRYIGHEFGSGVFRLDPFQNFGVWALPLYRGHQCGFRSIRMRKEDVSDAKCYVQLLSRREDHKDIRSSASPNSVREFLWEGTQKCAPKVDGFPKATHERIFAHGELRLTARCSPHCRNSDLRP